MHSLLSVFCLDSPGITDIDILTAADTLRRVYCPSQRSPGAVRVSVHGTVISGGYGLLEEIGEHALYATPGAVLEAFHAGTAGATQADGSRSVTFAMQRATGGGEHATRWSLRRGHVGGLKATAAAEAADPGERFFTTTSAGTTIRAARGEAPVHGTATASSRCSSPHATGGPLRGRAPGHTHGPAKRAGRGDHQRCCAGRPAVVWYAAQSPRPDTLVLNLHQGVGSTNAAPWSGFSATRVPISAWPDGDGQTAPLPVSPGSLSEAAACGARPPRDLQPSVRRARHRPTRYRSGQADDAQVITSPRWRNEHDLPHRLRGRRLTSVHPAQKDANRRGP